MRQFYLVVLCALLVTSVSWAQEYVLTDLGAVAGTSWSSGNSINGDGWVVGSAGDACLWNTQGFQVVSPYGVSGGTASSVSDTGFVTGRAYGSGGVGRAFLWHDGTYSDLPIPDGFAQSWGRSVNDDGWVAGYATTSQGTSQAYLWKDGAAVDLDIGGYFGYAYSINNHGQILGHCGVDGWDSAFLWDSGNTTILPIAESMNVYARAMNDRGDVSGWIGTSSGYRGFLWKDGVRMEIGTLGGSTSYAYGINYSGQVVGSATMQNGSPHAFLFSDGSLMDLNEAMLENSGWVLEEAYDINDYGQIVGRGTYGGETRAFVLTPVPEPSSLLALIVGLCGVGAALRRNGR